MTITTTKIASVQVYPAIQFLPTSLSFPDTAVGASSATQSVTATNYSMYNMTIAVSLTGADAGDYSLTNGCPTGVGLFFPVVPCTLTVTFTPTTTGSRTANVQVAPTVPSGFHYTAALAGTGI